MDKYNIYHQQPELLDIYVDSGWHIAKNCLYKSEISCSEIIFEAINTIHGKNLLLEYNDLNQLYTLTLSLIPRVNGRWNYSYDDAIFKQIKESKNLDDLYDDLFGILNYSGKNIYPIKVPTWWTINKNIFYTDDLLYDESECIFSAYSQYKPWCIDIMFYKNEEFPYKVCIGINKYKLKNMNVIYSFENLDMCKNFEFLEPKKTLDFLNEYMLLSDEYLIK